MINQDKKILMTEPVKGKTYSLFGNNEISGVYYGLIESYIDRLAAVYQDDYHRLLADLRLASTSRRNYRSWKALTPDFDFDRMEVALNEFIPGLDEHLKSIKALKKFDRMFNMKDFQYYIAMLEIETSNRANLASFKSASYKMALLPHCLHDQAKACLSESDGFENVCRRCSKACYIRSVHDSLSRAKSSLIFG